MNKYILLLLFVADAAVAQQSLNLVCTVITDSKIKPEKLEWYYNVNLVEAKVDGIPAKITDNTISFIEYSKDHQGEYNM